MTSSGVRVSGTPVIEQDQLISTSPATGEEVARLPVAGPEQVAEAVAAAREAATWWRELGFTGRRRRLLAWRATLVRRLDELTLLMHREGGKPLADALVESAGAIDHIAWAAKHARKVLGIRRVGGTLLQSEYTAHLEYQPYGVVGVIGPWNYPVLTPVGSLAYALAAGNTVVFKPSEYTPGVGQFLADTFAQAVPEHPVFGIVHGLGDTGAELVSSGVDKIAFTGSTRTGKRVLAAAAETLTPVLLECGGKDALIVTADADLDAAAEAAVWGAMMNAGQTCVGIERIYVVEPVYEAFLAKLTERAGALKVGAEPEADIGPMTMPGQIDVVRRHIDAALADGGRAVLGGADAVRPPFVHPTVLVDVPETSAAVCEETFGPTVTVASVADVREAVAKANALPYGLGGAVFGKSDAMAVARQLKSGMTSINSTISFAGIPSLPFGGVGDSGFGRIHGADGLREFARPKAIAKRWMPSVVKVLTFDRKPRDARLTRLALRLLHGRRS
ncbi:aldehyde dehydrogenase family protein [Longispora albida]|uniref:aldehyde dehydrogenase family protein n=1 Tax=Longispora albida TaxID=203523 RepID=UPI000375D982|nr:aldehyde dehydrogenase family protein [Longispora albida]